MNLKKNKIFFKIIIILFICYSTTFVYIEFFKIYYNRESNNRWYYLNQILEKEINISDSSVKYIFLGESRLNAGIDFRQIPDCWSLAYGGTTPLEQFYILKKYLEKYQSPDTLFYSVSPRFLCEIFSFWDYTVHSDFFNFEEFNEILKINNQYEDTILGFCPMLNFFLYKSNYIGYYQADIYLNKVFFGKSENLKNINWMQRHKGQQYHPNLKENCSELNYETKYLYFKPSPLLDYYFNKIFSLCKEKKIKVIFLFIPMNESSYKKLNSIFTSDYQTYIQKYQSKYPEFDISDTLYSYSDNFFGDNSHLNFSGQQEFTNQIIKKYFGISSAVKKFY
jgi:hypothetical protein